MRFLKSIHSFVEPVTVFSSVFFPLLSGFLFLNVASESREWSVSMLLLLFVVFSLRQ